MKRSILACLSLFFVSFHINSAADDDIKNAKVVAFFVHGMNETGEHQVYPFVNNDDGNPYLLAMPCEYFDFACSTQSWWRINFWECDLGQEYELGQMHKALQKTRKKYQGAQIVLIGVSRGASAIINYCANYPIEDIAACILESPYDHINNLMDHHYRLKSLGDCARTFFKILFYRCDLDNGMFPENQINRIDKDIPMLFVSVENDRSVPLKSIESLITKRKDENHKNVYHIHLSSGKHGRLLAGDQGELYQNVGHAFFARYDLPHVPDFAREGAHLLT